MIRIDGSVGEGGGQIVRTSISLSCLTGRGVEVFNIRERREKPGLRPQHVTAINCMKEIFDAETQGVEVGSKQVFFEPNEPHSGSYSFDIGTAGCMTLVFQTIILGVLDSKKSFKISLKGGSDVRWSPPWDFFENVFIPCIEQMGVNINTSLIKRGYYPKGGGEAEVEIQPVKKIHGLDLGSDSFTHRIQGVLHISGLPDHVNKRIKHAAVKTFFKENLEADIHTQRHEALSEGVGLSLWDNTRGKFIGSAVIGEKGFPSEILGSKCASDMLKEIESKATVDTHLFDQILPYMLYAKTQGSSSSVVTRRITRHAETHVWLLRKFFDDDFKFYRNKDNILAEI